jgi:hypothetical protein
MASSAAGWTGGKEATSVKFLIICRAIEPSPLPYGGQMELLEATQQRLASGADSQILDTLSFAGERTFALIIEAPNGQALDRSVFGLPAEPLCSFEVHALIEADDSSG